MATVTQEYLDGIREGRETLKREGPDNASLHLDNLNRTIASGFAASNPVGQFLRGERDFWRNQIKINKFK